jgi:hypothetical protein
MAQDKAGAEIQPGDTVELVYGGDQHHAAVTDVTGPHVTVELTYTFTTLDHGLRVVEKARKPRGKPGTAPATEEPPIQRGTTT